MIEQHYRPFWLVQGIDQLETSPNLYDTNELHRAQGHARLLLHSASSHVFKLEESTALCPMIQGPIITLTVCALYAEDLSTWEGCYQGAIGLAAQTTVIPDTNPLPLTLTPVKDLALHRDQLVLPLRKTAKASWAKALLVKCYRYLSVNPSPSNDLATVMLPDTTGISPNNDLRTLFYAQKKAAKRQPGGLEMAHLIPIWFRMKIKKKSIGWES